MLSNKVDPIFGKVKYEDIEEFGIIVKEQFFSNSITQFIDFPAIDDIAEQKNIFEFIDSQSYQMQPMFTINLTIGGPNQTQLITMIESFKNLPCKVPFIFTHITN
jgi:hypothetical protein